MLIKNILKENIGYIELQDIMGNDLAVVNAARVSYLGESKGDVADKKLLQYLWRNKHTSPFEMATIKLKVHCPLFVRSQWMRHRTFSYNEVSRRYTSENLEFYFPTDWRTQSNDNKQMSSGVVDDDDWFFYNDSLQILVNGAVKFYNAAIELGIAREQARMALPQNLYTTFIASGNLRNWLHFIELRSHEHAQWEIRMYSDAIRDNIIKEYFPWTYEEFMSVK